MAITQADIAVGRTVSLKMSEWRRLEQISESGSPAREVARIVREYLASLEKEATAQGQGQK